MREAPHQVKEESTGLQMVQKPLKINYRRLDSRAVKSFALKGG